jgi:hypothetical protein
MSKLTDAFKSFVQALIDTSEEIPGDSLADVVDYAADNYTRPADGVPGDPGAPGAPGAPGDPGAPGPENVRAGKVTLNGNAYTPVAFQADTAAQVTGGKAETYDLTGVGTGGTIIITPDGGAAKTATLQFTAGQSVSGASPSTDISGETDNKFMISVDGDEAEEVALEIGAGLSSGAAIAAEMESKIQALGGNKAGVTVDYDSTAAGKYAVVSPTFGTNSSVVITPAASGNITEELKLGTADDGVETVGTGDVADASAATAEEIAAVCNADMEGITADGSSGSLVFTSDTDGKDSKLVIGGGTLNAVVGLTESNEYYGAQGLGFESEMADDAYQVIPALNGASALTDKGLSINNRTTGGFNIICETPAAEDNVDLIIYGEAA